MSAKPIAMNFTKKLDTPSFANRKNISKGLSNLQLTSHGLENQGSRAASPLDSMEKEFFKCKSKGRKMTKKRSKVKPYLKNLDKTVDQFQFMRNQFAYLETGQDISPIKNMTPFQIFSPELYSSKLIKRTNTLPHNEFFKKRVSFGKGNDFTVNSVPNQSDSASPQKFKFNSLDQLVNYSPNLRPISK